MLTCWLIPEWPATHTHKSNKQYIDPSSWDFESNWISKLCEQVNHTATQPRFTCIQWPYNIYSCAYIYIYIWVSINRGTPNGWFINGKSYKHGWSRGTPISGNLDINVYIYIYTHTYCKPTIQLKFQAAWNDPCDPSAGAQDSDCPSPAKSWWATQGYLLVGWLSLLQPLLFCSSMVHYSLIISFIGYTPVKLRQRWKTRHECRSLSDRGFPHGFSTSKRLP